MFKFSFSISGKILETSIRSIEEIADLFPIGEDFSEHFQKIISELRSRDDAMEKAKYGYMSAHKSSNGDVDFTVELEDEFILDVISISTRATKSFAPLISSAGAFMAMAKVTFASSSKKLSAMSANFSKKWFETDDPKTKAKTNTNDPETDTKTNTDTSIDNSETETDTPEDAKDDPSEQATDETTDEFKEYGIAVIDEYIGGARMISAQVFRRYRSGNTISLTTVHNYGDADISHYLSIEDEKYTRMQAAGQITWNYSDLNAAKLAMYDRYAELTASNNKDIKEESVED